MSKEMKEKDLTLAEEKISSLITEVITIVIVIIIIIVCVCVCARLS